MQMEDNAEADVAKKGGCMLSMAGSRGQRWSRVLKPSPFLY